MGMKQAVATEKELQAFVRDPYSENYTREHNLHRIASAITYMYNKLERIRDLSGGDEFWPDAIDLPTGVATKDDE